MTAKEVLAEPGAPVIVFDHVVLAFDERVVLRDVSFTLQKGHTPALLVQQRQENLIDEEVRRDHQD